jgi:RNA polymerase sigma factor (sigma-70 family)
MKKYNLENYIRYKEDVKDKISMLPTVTNGDYTKLTDEELIIMFLPLVENVARKFSTSQQASGVMTILDLIQEGNAGLVLAVSKLERQMLAESEDQEKTLKSFLSKRIKGAIRRAVDINRGNMRIPEHKLNEIRKNFGKNRKMVEMFFNSIFLSIDEKPNQDENYAYQIPDKSEPYNANLLNMYLKGLLKKHLNNKEYEVLRLSYGLDCDKHNAVDIASKIGVSGTSAYVRISQLKKQAVQKLINNVDYTQVLDYL